ncbi:MAG: LPS export ABC transporter permease LptG [Pseudomonadota bacterium]
MSILSKYWFKEWLRTFVIVQAIVLCIYVFADYLTNIDKFLNGGLTMVQALLYEVLNTPFMFVQFSPAGMVLSVIVVFGIMSRNNELMALKSSGISLFYLVKPAAVTGVAMALIMFFLGETVVPLTMARANAIKYSTFKKHSRIYAATEDVWIHGDRKIIHVRYFNPKDKTISGISITFFDDGFNLMSRVDAVWGVYKDGGWDLAKVLEQSFVPGSDESDIKLHDQKHYALDMIPEDLQRVAKKSDEMSFFELSDYIRKVQNEGYDATVYLVDLYGKTAFPILCLIMALTGAAAGIRPFMKTSMPLGIALGLAVSFAYWIMYGFCTSLGYGRMLPPFVSAWAANFFFICFSSLYLVTAGE